MTSSVVELCVGLPLDPLPPPRVPSPNIPHAPKRAVPLSNVEKRQAVKNALRYFPAQFHPVLVKEFAAELRDYGHIYMYRFVPDVPLRAYPIHEIPAKTASCAGIILMILNNLDHAVAQFPEELVTYGGNGQVFSNWAQFWIVLNYLSTMTDEQTLAMYSGHPLGLFPSTKRAPRAVITNGMVIPNYSSRDLYDKFFALNVSMYGQMTAGSYCYIGPQGIVHGTTITVINAGRKYLKTEDLRGKVFVTAGLGGMSGAQPKAAVIAGCICVVAEVSKAALQKRQEQGWLMTSTDDLDDCIQRLIEARRAKHSISIGYLGNVVDLWEQLAVMYERTGELLVDLGSDQTSCHNISAGGYYPVGVSFDEANLLMVEQPTLFREHVKKSLQRQATAITKLSKAGMSFWDYGNAFLLEAGRAGADVFVDPGSSDPTAFKYPSYVQDIMGDIFSMGFGPFRWVVTSGRDEDLAITDKIAEETLARLFAEQEDESVKQQYRDNIHWIRNAGGHKLVVGSKARILYADQEGRTEIALAFNQAISQGQVTGPIIISRDHHDVSGTDSPFRETSNITDGSSFTADMAIQNVIGDAARGATWVSIHNGGGVGWGEVINGGFGFFLDGTEDSAIRVKQMLAWDVLNGVARRSWSGNDFGSSTISRAMDRVDGLKVTMPNACDEKMLDLIYSDH